ncbi:MAG TPA: hypothetical protein PLG94_13685 [Smithellaceae bacterium]|nr:hypothetical protein [Smithellaceae bacterium]
MGIFLPVCSGAGLNLIPSPPPESMLVSVASCGTVASTMTIQELIKLSEARKIFLDNGMFTFFRKLEKGERVIFDNSRPIYPRGVAMNLTGIHAIEAAVALRPHVLIVTDLPVPKMKEPYDHGDQELRFMTTTYHNLIRAKEVSQLRAEYCPDVELYYTFQGYNLNQIERVMKELNGLQFEGYCLATRALPWNKLIAMMLMLHCYGARKIHVLAGSNMPIMAVGAFMARHIFEEVSYDSSNWLYFALKGTFRFFGSMGTARAIKQVDIPKHVLSLTCDCLHCQGRSLNDIREMEHGREKQRLLALHNYYIETKSAKALYEHSETPAMLRDFLLAKSHREKLINEMYEALSGIYEMRAFLGDDKFTKGLAEYIFNRFKAR